jgi:hypothetical protein
VECRRYWVRTDYTFPGAEAAVGMTKFFFGQEMSDAVKESGLCVLPECTAVLELRVAAICQ